MAKKSKQTLFEVSEWWEEHWQGMPEYNQKDKKPWKTIFVHFSSEKDMFDFAKLVDQKMTTRTKFIWYPKSIYKILIDKVYGDSKKNES